MHNLDSSISPHRGMLEDDYGNYGWPNPHDRGLFGQSDAHLRIGELLPFTAGAVFTAAAILHINLVLDYPPFFSHTVLGSATNAYAIALFSAICLGTFALNVFFSMRDLRDVNLCDGMLSSFAALGIYLFPLASLHRPFLIAAVIVGAALTIWDCSSEYLTPSLAKLAWLAIINSALIIAPMVALVDAECMPIASSNISPAKDDSTSTEVLTDLFDKASLDDMSYQEVADVLQAVTHVESVRLGIQEHEPQVRVGYTGRATARYSPSNNTITFGATTLSGQHGMSGYDAVKCVAHEMAHAYEYAVVSGAIEVAHCGPLGTITPNDIARWREELTTAIDSNSDFLSYWYQDIEVRARNYANEEVYSLLALAHGA